MTEKRIHASDCDWHLDQYPWECTCGLIAGKKAMDELIAQDADLIDVETKTMTDERMIAWLREYAKLAVYLSEEEILNEIADRIEALEAEVERLKDQLSVETEPSPYCPICGSCGEEGCCGSKRCMYPDTGIETLQADNARLRSAISHIKDSWEWWQPDTYDRCSSVVEDAIHMALQETER